MIAPNRPDERVLVLLPLEQEGGLICSVVAAACLGCHACHSGEDLARELAVGAGAILVAEEALTAPTMSLLAAFLGGQPAWSDLPVLVFLGTGTEDSRAGLRMLDMLEPLGNVTTLERPVSAITLVSALRSALRDRRRQYQVRDLLAAQEQQQRRRDEFLGRLAHELRTPLASIRNAVLVLDRTGSQANIAIEQRGIIRRQADRVAHLIDKVLEVHRAVEGRMTLRLQPVDLAALARRCLQAVRDVASSRHVRLAADIGPDPVVIEGDPDRLEQALLELLHNAIQHTPEGKSAGVSVQREGGQAVVRVRDSGPGISSTCRPHLFDLFLQPEEGKCGPGLCVGLTLVGRLVELHGGTVAAASAATGPGTEFTIRLPAREGVQPHPGRGPRIMAEHAPSRRVLVIEDDPDGRHTVRLLLQIWGHRVETAADGRQGLQKALATRPEVALIDIGLPGDVDGYEVARRLRAALGRSILLVATTGYGQPHERERALEAGFDAHLVKPLEPEELSRLLAEGAAAATVSKG